MRQHPLRALLLVLVLLPTAACNEQVAGTQTDAEVAGDPDASAEAPDADEPPDARAVAGRDAGSAAGPDAQGLEVIAVSCAGPAAPVNVNTRVDISCTVNNGGKPVSAPVLSAVPSAGAVVQRGTSDLQISFALSTAAAGYTHPVDFADTTYQVTYEVHDAADSARFGRATVPVKVLGNYWIGDLVTPPSSGVLAYGSDGTPVGQAIGGAAVAGVYDLRPLPDGNVVVASLGQKAIKVFTRKGVAVARAFPDVDPFNSKALWTTDYGDAGPRQMAVVGDELWVAGAREDTTWGLAVFSWKTGAFLQFVPTPVVGITPFQFTSIARTAAGNVVAASSERRTLCLFDAAAHGPLGAAPCMAAGDDFCGGLSSFVLLADGTLVGAQKGDKSSSGCPLVAFGPTMAVTLTKYMPQGIEVYGMVESGDEIVALSLNQQTVAQNYLLRADHTTLASDFADWKIVHLPGGQTFNKPSGLLRLTAP